MTENSERQRSKLGRPHKGTDAKRTSFNTRIGDASKQQLKESAQKERRSLSEEIEVRLTRSLAEDAALGGLRSAMLFRALAGIAQQVAGAGEGWLNDYSEFQNVRAAWDKLLDESAPLRPEELDNRIMAARAIAKLLELPPDELPEGVNRGALVTSLRVMTRGMSAKERAEFVAAANAADALDRAQGRIEPDDPAPRPFPAMGWMPGHGG